jgi:acyl dehydratase
MSAYFEDLVVGETRELGSHTFTAEEIKVFARAYDPQPFHTDEEAAKASHFGALCASGWHTAGIWMRLMIEHRKREVAAAMETGRPIARLGPSPGFRDLKWLLPVYAGDTVAFSSTLTETRPSASRPEWGIARHHNVGVNQKGKRVFEFQGAVFVERRPG